MNRLVLTSILYFIFAIPTLFAQTANDFIPEYDDYFRYGVNPGYYSTWSNDTLLGNIAAGNPNVGVEGAGATTFRPALPEKFVNEYGYDVRVYVFEHYKQLGMDNLTVFLQDPEEAHQDMTEYCTGEPSQLFANMYDDIWDDGANGTPINDDNYFAAYIYGVATTYSPYVKNWEIWNEPDFSNSLNSFAEPGTPGNWWENDPDPCDIAIKAPIQHYVRLLRIAYEVIKSVDPTAYVTTGGLGYESFLHAILRNTDNPVDGSVTAEYPHKGGAYFDMLSYHIYPHVSGCYRIGWNNDIGDFDYQRHSDAGAECITEKKSELEAVLEDFGYDGTTYPEKKWIITETNVPRKQVDQDKGDYYGNNEIQRNWIIKAMIIAQQNEIEQVHIYQLGEREDEDAATSEFRMMGLYKNLKAVGPYDQEYTDEGIAMRTMSEFLSGLSYDAAQSAAMNLPPTVNGGAFVDDDGNYKYVLWAKTLTDQSEVANETYAFPASFGIADLETHGWDYSIEGLGVTFSSQNVSLTGSPLFLLPLASQTCNITPPPTISGANNFCVGSSLGLNAGGGYASYLWSNQNTSQTITVSTAGTYSVTVTDAEGCTGVASKVITESSNPVANITGNTSFCTGSSTTLDAGSGFDTYEWSDGNAAQTIEISAPGNYSVTVTSSDNCTASASVTVIANASPQVSITGNTTIESGETTTLNAGNGYTDYLWSNQSTTQTIDVSMEGTYSVTVTDDNGCTGTASVTVTELMVMPIDTIVIAANSGANQGTIGNCTTGNDEITVYELTADAKGQMDISINFNGAGSVQFCDRDGICSPIQSVIGTYTISETCLNAGDKFYIVIRPDDFGSCSFYSVGYSMNFINDDADIEPNNTLAQATPITTNFSGTLGYGYYDTDVFDAYSFEATGEGVIIVSAFIFNGGVLTLQDESGAVLATQSAAEAGNNGELTIVEPYNSTGTSTYYVTVQLAEQVCTPYQGSIELSATGTEIEVTCSEDIYIETTQMTEVVTWVEPTFFSTTLQTELPYQQVAGPPNGSAFPAGQTFEIMYASGLEEEVATCSFTVQVVSVQPSSTITTNCQGDVVQVVPPGTTTFAYTWNEPTATTDCELSEDIVINQTDGLPNGSDFPVDQDYHISFSFEDDCGTTESCSFSLVFEVESLSYEINCPSNIQMTIPAEETGTIVNYDVPNGSSNCAQALSINLVEGLESGEVFPVGTTTITYEIIIACQGEETVTETCSFDVVIEQESVTPPGDCIEEIADYEFLGEYEGHHYFKSTFKEDWNTAQALAESLGGYLVTINNQGENDFIQDNINKIVLIGLHDVDVEDTIEWANGETLDFTNLDPDGDNSSSNDYGTINYWHGTWGFVNEFVTKTFIVEIACDGGTNPTFEYDIVCPQDITVTVPAGTTEGVVVFEEPSATANCIEPLILVGTISAYESGDAFPLGTTTIEYIIDIDCGVDDFVSETCLLNITVEEEVVITPPDFEYMVTCPEDITVTVPAGETNTTVSFSLPMVTTNNCTTEPTIVVDTDSPLASGDDFFLGTTVIAYTIDIACGDVSFSETCTLNITVEEEEVVNPGDCIEEIADFEFLGEYDGHHYFKSTFKEDWNTAQALAESLGGYLATIDNQGENDFIQNNINKIVLIGLNDVTTEGALEWASGDDLGFMNLDPDGDNSSSNDYGTINYWHGTWGFVNEFVTKTFIVEIDCGSGTGTGGGGTTTQFDYTIDCPEDIIMTVPAGVLGTNVNYNLPQVVLDCSGEEMMTINEITNTKSGDFFPVGMTTVSFDIDLTCEELSASEVCTFNIIIEEEATIPTGDCEETIDGFEFLGIFGGHYYYKSTYKEDWQTAQADAQSLGAYLVSINSQAENDFVHSHVDKITIIGHNDANTEGVNEWASGEAFVYSNIDSDNDNSGANDYGTMNFWNGGWHYVNEYVSKFFIIELECEDEVEARPISPFETTSQPLIIKDLYPNPASNQISISMEIGKEQDATLQVFDLHGKLYDMQMIKGNAKLLQREININVYPAGIYFVKVSTADGQVVTKRFVKMKNNF